VKLKKRFVNITFAGLVCLFAGKSTGRGPSLGPLELDGLDGTGAIELAVLPNLYSTKEVIKLFASDPRKPYYSVF